MRVHEAKETDMHNVKIKAGDWVVVCDGRKALILQNAGDEVFPNLQTRETHEQANPRTNEQGTDRPGRVQESGTPGRSSVAQTDWHDQNEQEFVTALAKRLDEAVSGGETEALIVVAAPRALGVLREAYTPIVRKAVREEIAKDYVNMPVYEIEKHLTPAAA
jgi:protein required for attachment to host cells